MVQTSSRRTGSFRGTRAAVVLRRPERVLVPGSGGRTAEDRGVAMRLQPGETALGARRSHARGVCAEECGFARLRSHGFAVRSRAFEW